MRQLVEKLLSGATPGLLYLFYDIREEYEHRVLTRVPPVAIGGTRLDEFPLEFIVAGYWRSGTPQDCAEEWQPKDYPDSEAIDRISELIPETGSFDSSGVIEISEEQWEEALSGIRREADQEMERQAMYDAERQRLADCLSDQSPPDRYFLFVIEYYQYYWQTRRTDISRVEKWLLRVDPRQQTQVDWDSQIRAALELEEFDEDDFLHLPGVALCSMGSKPAEKEALELLIDDDETSFSVMEYTEERKKFVAEISIDLWQRTLEAASAVVEEEKTKEKERRDRRFRSYW